MSLWKCERCHWRTAGRWKPGRCMSNGHGVDMARPLLNQCKWVETRLNHKDWPVAYKGSAE